MRWTDADSFSSGHNGSNKGRNSRIALRLLPSYSPTLRSKLSALSTRLSGQGEKVSYYEFTVCSAIVIRFFPFAAGRDRTFLLPSLE